MRRKFDGAVEVRLFVHRGKQWRCNLKVFLLIFRSHIHDLLKEGDNQRCKTAALHGKSSKYSTLINQ